MSVAAIYALCLLGGIAVLACITAWSAQWQMLEARAKAGESAAALALAKEDAHDWAEKCRAAWERLSRPPSWMQDSSLRVQINENIVPVYKPFALFKFAGSERLENYTLLDGDRIIETKPLPEPMGVVSGDSFYLYLQVNK